MTFSAVEKTGRNDSEGSSVPNMPPLYKTSGKHHNLLSAVAWVSAVSRAVASHKWPTLPSLQYNMR